MRFLINASNLKAGGGVQVADSVCCQLYRFKIHQFVVVLSPYMNSTKDRLTGIDNVKVFTYEILNDFKAIILGKDDFLDKLVKDNKIDAVLTVFGPSRWRPKVKHLSGFALPQLVIPESPYFQRMGKVERLKWWWWCKIRKWSLKRSADYFWTENPYISARLSKLFNIKDVYTVSNYYNQVFDNQSKWIQTIKLPAFEGCTCLSVFAPNAHKNIGIIEGIVKYLRIVHPDFKIRFVLTCKKEQWPLDDDVINNVVYIGKTEVAECPNLYLQSDIMFMPTLLECFTATYPEAMRMEKPIVTTDLEFARGLCGEAACYYDAVNPEAAGEAIYKVASDKDYYKHLVEQGKKQLLTYGDYKQRADKLISLLETIAH